MSNISGKEPPVAILQILTVSFCASIVLLLFVGNMLMQQAIAQGRELLPSLEHPMALPLGAVGMLLLAMATLLPRFFYKATLAAQKNAKAPNAEFAAFFSSMILRFAMIEAVAILGFVVTMTSKDLIFGLIMSGAALLFNVAMFPTKAKMKAWLNESV